MALSPAEEAQTRELLAQQAAILSLADSEAAIISNLGSADVSLSDLTSATAVSDSDLLLIRQGTTDKSVTPGVIGFATKTRVQSGTYTVASSGGTADAITLSLTPTQTAFSSGPTWWRATAANATTTPTVKRDGLAEKTLVKGNNLPLVATDIPGAGAWMMSQYDATLDKEVLLNPAGGVAVVTPLSLRTELNAAGSAPIYAARATVLYSKVGATITILKSGNVSSVANVGTGIVDMNFSTAMDDVNFVTATSVALTNTTSEGFVILPGARTTTSLRIYTGIPGTAGSTQITFQDLQGCSVLIF